MPDDNVKVLDNQPVEAGETNRLISSEKVDGTAVYNNAGDHLGTIHHLMIDKFSGHVEYAVMSFGGFLGIGESYHPLPWRTLSYSPRLGGYRVDLDRNRLERSPYYTMNNQPDWSDRHYRKRIDEYWIPLL
jgi:PRC-barrel domain